MQLLVWIRSFIGVLTPEQWTALFTAIIALTGLAALGYASQQLRHGKDLAQVQHLISLGHQFENEPLIHYRKQLAAGRLRGDPEPSELNEVLNFFEFMALLERRKYLDPEDLWETFGYWLFPLYVDSEEFIKNKQRDDVNSYTGVKDLYSKLSAIERKHGGDSDRPSIEEIKIFWRAERDVVPGMPPRKRSKKQKKAQAQPSGIF